MKKETEVDVIFANKILSAFQGTHLYFTKPAFEKHESLDLP